MDDYGYAGIDFHNDSDLVLPEGYDWDASVGMLDLFSQQLYFYAFCLFSMFLVFDTIFIVLYRSCAAATDRYVSAHTERCYSFNYGPEQHRWRL